MFNYESLIWKVIAEKIEKGWENATFSVSCTSQRYQNRKEAGKPKKKIIQKNDKKETIQIFDSAAEAARALNLKDKSNICTAARKGGRAYGFYWEYIKERED